MDIINVELYSITVLIILIFDYVSKFKKKFNTASLLWLFIAICSLFIAISNISFYVHNNYIIKVISLTINLLATISSSLYIYIYIKYVYIKKEINIKKEFFIALGSIIGCVIFTLIITFSHNFGYTLHSLDRGFFRKLLTIAVIPNVSIFIYYIFKSKIEGSHVNHKIIITLFISIIALLLDQHYESLYFVSAAYTLIVLIIYISKHEELLNTDPLTGLSNKRALEAFIKNIRPGIIVAAYSIDINKFKYINDTYGHLKGDYALKKTAEILRNSARAVDLVIRNGGDEFLIIAVIKKEEDSNVIHNRIQTKLNNYNKNATIKLSLSIGFGTLVTDENTTNKKFDTFLKSLDKKMYEEKEKYHKLNN